MRGEADIKKSRRAIIKRVNKGRNKGQFRFVLIGDNGEMVADSHPETYTAKAMCKKTLTKYFASFRIVDETLKQ